MVLMTNSLLLAALGSLVGLVQWTRAAEYCPTWLVPCPSYCCGSRTSSLDQYCCSSCLSSINQHDYCYISSINIGAIVGGILSTIVFTVVLCIIIAICCGCICSSRTGIQRRGQVIRTADQVGAISSGVPAQYPPGQYGYPQTTGPFVLTQPPYLVYQQQGTQIQQTNIPAYPPGGPYYGSPPTYNEIK